MQSLAKITYQREPGRGPARFLVWAFLLCFSCVAGPALGQIYQWEYINPSDPSRGKRKSSVLTPDGEGAYPKKASSIIGHDHSRAYLPKTQLIRYQLAGTNFDEAYLAGADLRFLRTATWSGRYADLTGANLTEAHLGATDLTGANLSNADLTGTFFENAILTDVVFTGANIEGADFRRSTDRGFTADQFYQTACYQQHQLGAIGLVQADVRGWDFSHQSMPGARFYDAELEGADFTDAIIAKADFESSGLAAEQLYSTADYKNGVLDGIRLSRKDLREWDFSNQSLKQAELLEAQLDGASFEGANLTYAAIGGTRRRVSYDVNFRNANLHQVEFGMKSHGWKSQWERADFTGATLTDVEFSSFKNSTFDDAVIHGAQFAISDDGFTLANFLSTASYKLGNLTGTEIENADFEGIDFSGKNLARVQWTESNLNNANFRGIAGRDAQLSGSVEGADFREADLTKANLTWTGSPTVDFRGANLTSALLNGSSLKNLSLTDAIIYGADLTTSNGRSDLTREQLYSTASYQLRRLGPVVLGGDMQGWDFEGQNLTGAFFDRNSKLQGANWDRANLRKAYFVVASMPDTDFRQAADVREAIFSGTDIARSDFRGMDLTGAQFANGSAAGARFDGATLRNSIFHAIDVTDANFNGADLTGSSLVALTLTDANFDNAIIRQVNLRSTTSRGLTRELLESTRSFKEGDLFGINLENNVMDGWDFRGQDLRGSDLRDTSLRGASFALADLRGGLMTYSTGPEQSPQPIGIPWADLSRSIRTNGQLDVLRVDTGETLTIRNSVATFNRPPTVDITVGSADLDAGGTLRMLLSGTTWKSTLVIPGDVSYYDLAGTLELDFDRSANPESLVGRTFQLFDWPEVDLNGEFQILSKPRYNWDLSLLYTNGTIRLVGIVPEPATVVTTLLLAAAAVGTVRRRRRQ